MSVFCIPPSYNGLVDGADYGAAEKQVLRTSGEIAGMGMMGLGGLIAVIGGLLFVIVVIRAMLQGARPR